MIDPKLQGTMLKKNISDSKIVLIGLFSRRDLFLQEIRPVLLSFEGPYFQSVCRKDTLEGSICPTENLPVKTVGPMYFLRTALGVTPFFELIPNKSKVQM